MRIIHQDARRGLIELLPETLDDLWHLSHIRARRSSLI